MIGWVVVLSLGHHLDHLLRVVTVWPFESEVNAFTYSLAIYPTIVAGVLGVEVERRRAVLVSLAVSFVMEAE